VPARGGGRAEPPEARAGRERLRRVFFPVARRRRAAENFGTLLKMQYKLFCHSRLCQGYGGPAGSRR
jgi:hypothetical protein